MRRKPTWAERLLWSWVRNRRFNGYKFHRQQPVGPYFLDFFCAEAKLGLELDGAQHGFPGQRQKDVDRDTFLAGCGIKTLRFWNGQLRRERQYVRDVILSELQARAPHALPTYTRPGLVGSGVHGQ